MTLSTCKRWTAAITTGAALTATMAAHGQIGSSVSGAVDDGIAREAIGARADRLKAMELEPFDAELWGKLTEWSGEPVTAASTDGKVVLIGTWASWNPTSTRSLAALDRLAKQHADDGLVVLGLHHPTGWESAGASAARMSFASAHDADGAWRTGLDIDQDPDFYLIDRAGQLRFADIHTSALSKAVDTLLAETISDAAGTRAGLESAAAQREQDFRRTRALTRTVEMVNIPSVSFTAPSAEAYNDVKWPESPEMKGDENSNRRGQEDWVPQAFALPDAGMYPPGKPDTNGKLMVVYFWNHEMKGRAREFMRTFVPQVDLLGRQYGRDVEFVGLLTEFENDNNNRRNGDDNEDWDPAKLRTVVEQTHRTHNLKHPLIIDDPGFSLQTVLRSPATRGQRNSRDEYAWPYAAIVTSDGLVRWGGYVGPEFRQSDEVAGYDDFILALQRMIDRDPGVKARRKAEAAYIREHGGG